MAWRCSTLIAHTPSDRGERGFDSRLIAHLIYITTEKAEKKAVNNINANAIQDMQTGLAACTSDPIFGRIFQSSSRRHLNGWCR